MSYKVILNRIIMKGFQIDLHQGIMNCVTPRGNICVFIEADSMVVVGKDVENSAQLDWGRIELVVGDKIKVTATEGEEYDRIYARSFTEATDDELLIHYLQLKKFLIQEGVLK